MNSPQQGLYRSSNQYVIGGVASGIAEHLKTDPVLIRVLFLLIALFGGGGILIYLILWIALPAKETHHFQKITHTNMENKESSPDPKQPLDMNKKWQDDKNKGNLIAGLILITLGCLFLLDRFLPRVEFSDLWPILLLVVGILLIRTGYSRQKK